MSLSSDEHDDGAVHVKWNHHATLRRFQLPVGEWRYSCLMEKCRLIEPLFNEALCYVDEDGDKIVFSTNDEMDELLAHFRRLHVHTIKIESIKKKDTPNPENATNSIEFESKRRCINSLEHACKCKDANCRKVTCSKMKKVVQHVRVCKKHNGIEGCKVCKALIALSCENSDCLIPSCGIIREKMMQWQDSNTLNSK